MYSIYGNIQLITIRIKIFQPDKLARTWRAPSSPHHACGLNGSLFLRTCGSLSAAQAGRLLGVLVGAETCGTLRGRMFYATLLSTHERLNLVGGAGKRLVFFEGVALGLGGPYLLGVRPNFDGLG